MEADIKLDKSFEQLSKQLDEIGKDYRFNATNKATGAIAREAKKTAKETTAFKDDTGQLRKSIGVKRDRDKISGKWYLVARARHAHLLEFGTVRMAAKPFLLPAALSSLSAGFTKAADVLRKEIRKYERKYGRK